MTSIFNVAFEAGKGSKINDWSDTALKGDVAKYITFFLAKTTPYLQIITLYILKTVTTPVQHTKYGVGINYFLIYLDNLN